MEVPVKAGRYLVGVISQNLLDIRAVDRREFRVDPLIVEIKEGVV